MIHLTNDAIQKQDDSYGRFERGNKLSYDELDKYIKSLYPHYDFYKTLLTQMKVYHFFKYNVFSINKNKEIGKSTIKSVYGKIDPNKKESSMEVFGLDFMIDNNLKVWLIEVNTNPAIDICCPLLSKIIPSMIENTFKFNCSSSSFIVTLLSKIVKIHFS